MRTTKYQVGLLGCGNMGGVWNRTVAGNPDCTLRFAYDPNPESAARRAEEVGARPVETPGQIFDSPDIDLVVIATPTFTHPDLVVQAAQAGKHVLCEKPMALTLAACRRMVDACSEAGVKLAIGQSIRFWSAFLKVRRLVAEGAVGTPCLAQVHRMGKAGVRRVDAEKKPSPRQDARPWRFDTRYAGGNILESAVHELDFTRSIFGEVRSVYCEATGGEAYGDLKSPVVIQAMVDFENGAQATVRQGGIVGFPCRGSWVAGTGGTLSFDVWEGPVYHHLPDADAPRVIPCEQTDAYDLELRDLLHAVEQDIEPENSGINGLKNIALGLAMYRSIELGKRLDFKDGLPLEVPMDYQYSGPNNVKE